MKKELNDDQLLMGIEPPTINKFNIGRETKAFNAWLKSKYKWIDNDMKRLMFKAWCGRAKKVINNE